MPEVRPARTKLDLGFKGTAAYVDDLVERRPWAQKRGKGLTGGPFEFRDAVEG